jgi:hypothetical protein
MMYYIVRNMYTSRQAEAYVYIAVAHVAEWQVGAHSSATTCLLAPQRDVPVEGRFTVRVGIHGTDSLEQSPSSQTVTHPIEIISVLYMEPEFSMSATGHLSPVITLIFYFLKQNVADKRAALLLPN